MLSNRSSLPSDVAALGHEAPVGLLRADPYWRIESVNHTFEQWTGRTQEELAGLHLQELLTAGSKIFLQTHVDPLLRMQESVRELVIELDTDPPMPILLGANLRDGYIDAALVDIRDRRNYERELQQARQRAEATAARHALLARIGPRLVGNRDLSETAQAAVEEAVPRLADGCAIHVATQHEGLTQLARQAPEGVPSLDEPRDAAFRSGRPVLEPPCLKQPVLGFAVYPLISSTIFGTITFFWTTVAADPKQDLLQEYADLVALALDRGRAESEALEAVRAREAMIDVLVHEFANPLNAARLQIGLWRAKGAQVAHIEPVVQAVEERIARMQLLLRDVSDAARIHGGSFGIDPRRNDLVRVVSGAVELLRPSLAEQGVEVRIGGVEEAPAWVDAGRIEQVVTNLVTNAAKYGRGPVEIDVCSDPLRIIVRDHGKGIPKEARDAIFEKYRRLEEKKHGTGLGLYIVRHLVAAHHGRVWCDDAPGGGARFVVELPEKPVKEGT